MHYDTLTILPRDALFDFAIEMALEAGKYRRRAGVYGNNQWFQASSKRSLPLSKFLREAEAVNVEITYTYKIYGYFLGLIFFLL